jgi:hypothetical protein
VRAALALILVAAPAAAADAPKLLARETAERGAYERAVRLADEVGARPAASPAYDRAVAWAVAEMKTVGLSGVHTEPVTAEPWFRGENDGVETVTPFARRLRSLALGHSPVADLPPTPLVEVSSLEEVRKLGARA